MKKEEITIIKTEKTNIITITDQYNNQFLITLTNKDITNLHKQTIKLKEGEIKTFEKE